MTRMDNFFPDGERVTVTYTDETGTVRAWHGFWGGTSIVRVSIEQVGGTVRYRHVANWRVEDAPDGRVFLRLRPAYGRAYNMRGLPASSENWFNSGFVLWFWVDLPGLTITPLTAEGEKYLASIEPPSFKRDRLLALFAETHPDEARELDAVIDRLVEQARDEGERDAARNDND